MKELILTIPVEKYGKKTKKVVFRGVADICFLDEHSVLNPNGKDNKPERVTHYRLTLYDENHAVFVQHLTFYPSYLLKQINSNDIEIYRNFVAQFDEEMYQALLDECIG